MKAMDLTALTKQTLPNKLGQLQKIMKDEARTEGGLRIAFASSLGVC